MRRPLPRTLEDVAAVVTADPGRACADYYGRRNCPGFVAAMFAAAERRGLIRAEVRTEIWGKWMVYHAQERTT